MEFIDESMSVKNKKGRKKQKTTQMIGKGLGQHLGFLILDPRTSGSVIDKPKAAIGLSACATP